MKHLERIILGFAIIFAAMSLAACSNDDNENEFDAYPGGDFPTVTDMACLLRYDEATAQWYAYPVGRNSPFGSVSESDELVIVAKNASQFLSTHDDVTAIVSGFFTFTSSEPTEWGTLYRFTLTISTLTPYNDWCGTKE